MCIYIYIHICVCVYIYIYILVVIVYAYFIIVYNSRLVDRLGRRERPGSRELRQAQREARRRVVCGTKRLISI